MHIRQIIALALAPCLSSLAGCSDGMGPDDTNGEAAFALHSVNGRSLPTTVAEGGGERYVLVADTLRFSADGTVARTTVVRHLSTSSLYPPDATYHQEWDLPYVLEGIRLTIGYRDPCPPNALCVGFETGTFTPTGLRVVGRLLWPGDPILEFHRINAR